MFRLDRFIALAFASMLFASVPAAASSISISFENLPGADGVLGTADDVPTANDFVTPLRNEFSSVGVTFSQGSLMQASFFDSNPQNHFISSTNPIGTFSVPVYGISIQSNSYWNATLTAYDARGNVLSASTLFNPNEGSSALFGTFSVTSAAPISSFSILPANPQYILNLDNMVLNTSPVPEPSMVFLLSLGMMVLLARYVRRPS